MSDESVFDQRGVVACDRLRWHDRFLACTLRSPYFMAVSRSMILVTAALACLALSGTRAVETKDRVPIIARQVDHIMVASRQATELFALLTDTFGLPVVWPLSDYGSFGSGGVSFGNVNLEVLRSSATFGGGVSSAFVGFAWEPGELRESLVELKARGIRFGTPSPFRGRQRDGSTKTLWTTVSLPELSSDHLEVFFCAYNHDVAGRRDRFHEQLKSRNGGPLTVHSVREIVCGARDATAAKERWQNFLNPRQLTSDGVWKLEAGPAIRVLPAQVDQILKVIVNVTSLEQARRFLREHHLLGADGESAITLRDARFPGFELTLVEVLAGS
jgi:hypothetical protein